MAGLLIGTIAIADGIVIIQRDNQSIELQEGDSIYLNDIIEAKSGSVGIAFTDQTTMSIDAGSQIVVDEFVYDPGNTGSMNINVIVGNFSYISGEISKLAGDVEIVTPTSTLTIQGTNVAGKVLQEGEQSQFVLLPNADGTVGQILITNQSGSVLLTEAYQSTTITSAFMPPTVPVILPEEIVLEKFSTTINTIQKTKKKVQEEQAEEEKEIEDTTTEEENTYIPPVTDPVPPVTDPDDVEDPYVPPTIDEETDTWYDEFIEDQEEEEQEEINEAPTFETTSTTSIGENISSSSDVVTMSATDPNNDSLTYSITSGNDDGKFTINSSTGAITTAAGLDYETTTSYTLKIAVSDGSLTTTTTKVINITDAVDQYTEATTSGTAASVWGASYNADAVLNNAWADSKILSIGSFGAGLPNTFSSTTILTDAGYTVTRSTWNQIDEYSRKTLTQYEQIWDWRGGDAELTTAQTNQWKTYLRDGGYIMMIGENDWWDTQGNLKIEKFISDIDSDVPADESPMINGTTYTDGGATTEVHTVQAAYNVDDYNNTGTGTTYTIDRDDGIAAAGVFNKDYMGDGSFITISALDSDKGSSAEWGGDVTDSGYIGTFASVLDISAFSNDRGYRGYTDDIIAWGNLESKAVTGGIVTDTEYLPIGGLTTTYGWTNTNNNQKSYVEAYNLGNNVYIGGGFEHLDWAWDESAEKAYVVVNADMDGSDEDDAPSRQDDHYLVVGADTDGDGNLWEQGDVFDLDKIKILDDSEDYLIQDSDASGDYYFKITPVTYTNSSWTVETDNTVTVTNTTDYNDYLDLTSNSDFDDINYAIIETESALISDVVVTY
jgi:hypothetical protein